MQPRQLLGSDAEFLNDPRTGLLSGWGATHSTEKAAFAGLDVQSGADFDVEHYFGEPLRAAVREGRVLPERIDDMVDWQLRSLFRLGVIDNPPTPGGVIDLAAGRRIAQRAAERGLVLLKNEADTLPVAQGLDRILVIGRHADVGVLAGGGPPPSRRRGAWSSRPASTGSGPTGSTTRPLPWTPSGPRRAQGAWTSSTAPTTTPRSSPHRTRTSS
ncbi:glycoside hydrolase family 3 C-terminal domain-containing protein [Streptomyces sp. S1D4-11]|nr:glycoside hydrolase family 3 C-terminal domain-containing protein [Streptomyces sp. S1D4-11]